MTSLLHADEAASVTFAAMSTFEGGGASNLDALFPETWTVDGAEGRGEGSCLHLCRLEHASPLGTFWSMVSEAK